MSGEANTSAPSEPIEMIIARRASMLPYAMKRELLKSIDAMEVRGVEHEIGKQAQQPFTGDHERAGELRDRLAGFGGITLDNVEEAFTYQPWMPDQVERGNQVREGLIVAVKAILRNVERSPARTRAINALVLARLEANTAITFRGRF